MEDLFTYQTGEFLLTPCYVLIIFLIGYFIKQRHINDNPIYKYFLPGLMIKVFSSIIFLIIFTEYYGYGDTVDYIYGSIAMSKLMFKDFGHYLQTLLGMVKYDESWYFFDSSTTFPQYFMWKDPNTRFVIGLSSIINTLGFRYFMPTTVLMAAFSYMGVWKLFLFFTNYYPKLSRQMAIAVLFMPSVIFWGSGVMKDTYTFAAAGWFIYNMMQIFQKREKVVTNILLAIINVIIIISIKPYIFVALFPGTIIWVFFNRMQSIKNTTVRVLSMPFVLIIMFATVFIVFSSMKGGLGGFGSVDQVVKKAQIIQEDLMRSEQYGKNFYNVGKIDGTMSGLIKVAPKALLAGMFRPYIWEAKNPVMVLSGLENIFLLIITLYLLIKLKFIRFFQFLFSDPILIFSIMFSIFFMLGVGIASANFGALVRYKIPAIPFFVASIFIMLNKYKTYKLEKEHEFDELEPVNSEKEEN
ncbi:MAG: hypothetical protein WCQ95_02630 [Bacteroidota bacterium]